MQVTTNNYQTARGWAQPLTADWNSAQTLVLVFGARELGDDTAAFASLQVAFPSAVIAGCSTAGEIAGLQVQDASLSIALARFEHCQLRIAHAAIDGPQASAAVGQRLGEQLSAPDLRAVFVLSDGLSVNGTALVAGLRESLPAGVSISGGLAGDGSAFGQTWVLVDGQPRGQSVSAVGLYGERLRVAHGSEGGWSDFGPERRITRSEGNVLFELDGKPALDLYKTYLGDLAQGLPGTALLFPLSVRPAAGEAAPLVRTILAIDETAKSMTFAGDVPQGHVARLMRATNDSLIDSASDAMAHATASLGTVSNALAVAVSCVGRRLVLGERTDEEVETIVAGLPVCSAHVGFYSYGEISPALEGGSSDLHNQTMTITLFSEV